METEYSIHNVLESLNDTYVIPITLLQLHNMLFEQNFLGKTHKYFHHNLSDNYKRYFLTERGITLTKPYKIRLTYEGYKEAISIISQIRDNGRIS